LYVIFRTLFSPGIGAWYASAVPAPPPLQTVILAGGLGTRMGPRTERTPKFLLPVAGRPFGAWLLERLAAAGFGEALLCVGHLGGAIREAVGEGFAGLRVRYAEDGPALLGTAGALRRALPLLESTFLVTYGDSYLPFDYLSPLGDLRAHPEALGAMAVYRNRDRLDASNTSISGDRVVRYEKRSVRAPRDPALDHIDYGAMALRREVIEALPEGAPSGLDAVQRDLAARGLLRAVVAERRFYEIGSEAGLRDLEAALREGGAGGEEPPPPGGGRP
jgi:NDP-sugar pyrophosphorylase family protein